MSTQFRLPHITGKTVPEQLSQIVSYLRGLALQLQQLPQRESAPAQEEAAARSTSFQTLRVHKKLTADGGVNGVHMQSVSLHGTARLCLQSRFTGWDDEGYIRQSFLIAGFPGRVPVLGLVSLDSAGRCAWNGTEGVTVAAGEGGKVVVSFDKVAYDTVLVQSTDPFAVQSG